MNNNELTYNELEESELIPHKWCSITKTDHTDPEVCFKLKLWQAQCNFAKNVLIYVQKLNYGIVDSNCFNELLINKYILEILNSISPKNLETTEIDYNNLFKKL